MMMMVEIMEILRIARSLDQAAFIAGRSLP